MIRYSIVVWLALVLIATTKCGSGFEDHDLSGKYAGLDWEYKSAKVIVNPVNSDVFIIEISDAEFDEPCGNMNRGNFIGTTCPAKVGTYEFGEPTLRFATFQSTGSTIAVNSGAIQILAIDKENKIVKGRLMADYDELNFANGYFTAWLCAE